MTVAPRPKSLSLASATASSASLHLVDDGRRAEQLLAVGAHLRGDVGEDRRLDEGARRGRGACRR